VATRHAVSPHSVNCKINECSINRVRVGGGVAVEYSKRCWRWTCTTSPEQLIATILEPASSIIMYVMLSVYFGASVVALCCFCVELGMVLVLKYRWGLVL